MLMLVCELTRKQKEMEHAETAIGTFAAALVKVSYSWLVKWV